MPSVLVTGAGRGFGKELVQVYARRGWTVFPLVRTIESALMWARDLPCDCHPLVANVALPSVEETIGAVLGAHAPSLDLLVNNAGSVRKHRWLPAATVGDMEEAFRVHCLGAFRCIRGALPFLRKAPTPTIVNISSRFGSIARMSGGDFRGIYSYSIAKCALDMLTACLDHELRPAGIRVLAVHPGQLKTEAAAVDADTEPQVAARKFADWLDSVDRGGDCVLHDLMTGSVIPW